jgi:hypothetical protein
MLEFASIEEAFPNDDRKKKSKKSVDKADCKPLQAPTYQLPLCDTNKEVLKNAMDASLNPNPNFNENSYKNDGIKAYDFDEYDAYLSVSDIKTNNVDSSNEYRTTPFLADYLKSLKNNFNKDVHISTDKPSNIEQFTNLSNLIDTNIKIDVNLYNLFLFIFLGIIIIILIHQITSLVK